MKSETPEGAKVPCSALLGLPTCPYCKTVMRPVNFVGYYDEFHFWGCDCEVLPNAVKEKGAYA